MVRKIILTALAVLLALPAYAEPTRQQQQAEASRQLGELYASLSENAKIALALGMQMGMGAVINNPGIAIPEYPPDYADIMGLLNYCYVNKNCEHVSAQFIALVSWQKPSDAHAILLEAERRNVEP